MRQTLLLNLVVLCFFVLLFGSIYRKRRSSHLRMWMAAWLFAVVHFAVPLWEPASAALQQAVQAASLTALLLCGLFVLLSHPSLDGPGERGRVAAGVGGLMVALGVAMAFQATPDSLFLGMEMLLELAGAAFLVWYNRHRPLVAALLVMLVSGCSVWSAHELLVGNTSGNLDVLFMELFGLCGLVFFDGFGRRSAGSWTAVVGLVAWAAVFPLSMLMSARWPRAFVNPDIWNVPKVVVAFGMVVILFENEVAIAKRDREQYRSLFDNNPTPMWIFDKDSTQLLEANGAAERMFGWRWPELQGLTLRDLMSPSEPADGGLLGLNRLLGDGSRGDFPAKALEGEVRSASMRLQTRRGEEVIVEASLQRAKFGGEEARLLMAKDVTAQVRAHEQLTYLANHDPLTGLPNRLLLQDRLKAALASALRHGTQAAVLCLDLDRFKGINDTYGHAAGDSCLRDVAQRLQARLRAVDTAARTGGEEFVVVLNDVRSAADAERVADDLLESLRSPHDFGGHSIDLSVSIGVAMFPDHGLEASELWHNADAAMYHAKQSGGNQHRVFSMAL